MSRSKEIDDIFGALDEIMAEANESFIPKIEGRARFDISDVLHSPFLYAHFTTSKLPSKHWEDSAYSAVEWHVHRGTPVAFPMRLRCSRTWRIGVEKQTRKFAQC
jgi:hypothetical protein